MVPIAVLGLGEFFARAPRVTVVLALHAQHEHHRGGQHPGDPYFLLARRIRFRPPAFPRQQAVVFSGDYHHADSLAGPDGASVHHVFQDWLVWHLSSAHSSLVWRKRVLHLPDPPVHADNPPGAGRCRSSRWAEQLANLLAY